MNANNFNLKLTTEKSPEQVFQAILNVRNWWVGFHKEEFLGDTDKLNEEFSFNAENGLHFSKQKIVELIPNKKIVWLITESNFTYIQKADEWTGTKVIFEISKTGNKTELLFTHEGLTPEVECYNACAPSWTEYLQEKLLPLINSGNISSNVN